ncbi:Coiled-coil domain-containing protein 113, variant 2 [Clonorchis sinensis]|nr:Coiled-coil domain-containing protein 113, variant 2 [Clonorchis sinensis]GAA48669.1 coiled-coil domain-containing protein 113 [Clonorchis sinensis]
MKEYKRKCHYLKQTHEAMVEWYTASIAALKVATKEVARNRATFDRTVNRFLPSDNTAAHQTSNDAVRFVNFHKIYLNRLDAMEQNLRVENSNIRKSCRKMYFYAKQREHFEMPKGRIDFEHMTLRCEVAYSTFMDKNDEITRLKLFVNKVGRELTRYRTELSNEMKTSVKLGHDMNHMFALIKLIENEVKTHIQHVDYEKYNTKLIKAILAKYKVPSTSEYIKNLEEIAALVRDDVAVNRKKSIAELNLRRHKLLWSQIKLGKASISSRSTICSKPRLGQNLHKQASRLVRLQ